MSSKRLPHGKKAVRQGEKCGVPRVRIRSDIPKLIRIVLFAVRSWNSVRRTIPGGRKMLSLVATDFPHNAALLSSKDAVVTEFPAGMGRPAFAQQVQAASSRTCQILAGMGCASKRSSSSVRKRRCRLRRTTPKAVKTSFRMDGFFGCGT